MILYFSTPCVHGFCHSVSYDNGTDEVTKFHRTPINLELNVLSNYYEFHKKRFKYKM